MDCGLRYAWEEVVEEAFIAPPFNLKMKIKTADAAGFDLRCKAATAEHNQGEERLA